MANLPQNPVTESQLEAFLQQPSQAVLLSAPAGSGVAAVAEHIIHATLQLTDQQSIETYAYSLVLRPEDGKAIGIEIVRQLEHFLSLKVPISTNFNRSVLIVDSHLMTNEAQNALLKTLEEPPAGALLLLTASNPRGLLPTVRSRLQTINVKPPARKQVIDYFVAEGMDVKKVAQAYAMTGGLLELMQAILSDKEHPLEYATEIARKIAGGQAYDRLLLVDELSKQKQLAIDTTFILQQMARISLQQASGTLSTRWQAILKASYEAHEALQSNAQAKLVITNMMLHI